MNYLTISNGLFWSKVFSNIANAPSQRLMNITSIHGYNFVWCNTMTHSNSTALKYPIDISRQIAIHVILTVHQRNLCHQRNGWRKQYYVKKANVFSRSPHRSVPIEIDHRLRAALEPPMLVSHASLLAVVLPTSICWDCTQLHSRATERDRGSFRFFRSRFYAVPVPFNSMATIRRDVSNEAKMQWFRNCIGLLQNNCSCTV